MEVNQPFPDLAQPRQPGPLRSLQIGRQFRRDPLQTLVRLHDEYGDVVRLRLGRRNVVILNHPDDIREVLVSSSASFRKVDQPSDSVPLLGNGLLRSEGDFHRRQRRLIQPAFHRERIATYGAVMSDYARQQAEQWRNGATVDLATEMSTLTLAIVAKTLFGVDIGDEAGAVRQALGLAMERSTARRFSPLARLLQRLPLPRQQQLARARATLDAIVLRIIAERRAQNEDRGDLLSTLLNAVDDEGDGQGMTDRQLRDEVMTLFLAGHETTSNWLTWTWYLLAQHPEVEERLHRELDSVLGGRLATVMDVANLPYTKLVLTESLRCYPPAWLLARQAATDCTARITRISAGTIVLLSPWVVHHDPRWYPNPYDFDVDRWRLTSINVPRLAFFPFGAGSRICIGEPFAWLEATLILATLAQRIRIEQVGQQPVIPEPLVTLRPKGGLQVTLRAR